MCTITNINIFRYFQYPRKVLLLTVLVAIGFSSCKSKQQAKKTVAYINRHKPSMHECYYKILPEIFLLSNLTCSSADRTNVISIGNNIFIDDTIKYDTLEVKSFKNRLLYESLDNRLKFDTTILNNTLHYNYSVKNEYFYNINDSELTININANDRFSNKFYKVIIQYDKDLLKHININEKSQQASLSFDFFYRESLINGINRNDTILFPFDKIILVFSKGSTEKTITRETTFSYYSFYETPSSSTTVYKSQTKVTENTNIDFQNVLDKYCRISKVLSELNSFLSLNDLSKSLYFHIDEKNFDCSLHVH